MNTIKLNIIYILIFLSINQLTAQNYVGEAHYKQILNLSSYAPWDTTGVISTLIFSKNQSLYYFNKLEGDSINDDKIRTIRKRVNDYQVKVYDKDRLGEGVFKDFLLQKIVLREIRFKKSYLISDTIPKFKWEILPEMKNFGELKCQKAICKYKGRIYTAWFAISIPYSNGPWKFSGLPGLILEVSDDKKEVQFLFEEIDLNSNKKINDLFVSTGIVVNRKELNKIFDEEEEKEIKADMSRAPKGVQLKVKIIRPDEIEKEDEN